MPCDIPPEVRVTEFPPEILRVFPLRLRVWPSVFVSVSISLNAAVKVEPSP